MGGVKIKKAPGNDQPVCCSSWKLFCKGKPPRGEDERGRNRRPVPGRR